MKTIRPPFYVGIGEARRLYEETVELTAIHAQQQRWAECTRRFVKPEDKALSDRDFVKAVINRWLRYVDEPCLDPNE